MVVVKLQGGLGNQMFQYAAARALITNGESLYLDTSFLQTNTLSNDGFTARAFELGIFTNLKYKRWAGLKAQITRANNRLGRVLKRMVLPHLRTVDDRTALYEPGQQQIIYMDGYFQNHTRFSHIREALLKDFAMPQLDNTASAWLRTIAENTNSVSIHVRRGDYLKPAVKKYHGLLQPSYYVNAMTRINQEVMDPHYYVFSDDIAWCRANLQLSGAKTDFVPAANPAWQDMALMSHCRHHIIANSSFSWWAAWLGQSDNKLVIAPENWFADATANSQTQDLLPPEWIRI